MYTILALYACNRALYDYGMVQWDYIVKFVNTFCPNFKHPCFKPHLADCLNYTSFSSEICAWKFEIKLEKLASQTFKSGKSFHWEQTLFSLFSLAVYLSIYVFSGNILLKTYLFLDDKALEKKPIPADQEVDFRGSFASWNISFE